MPSGFDIASLGLPVVGNIFTYANQRKLAREQEKRSNEMEKESYAWLSPYVDTSNMNRAQKFASAYNKRPSKQYIAENLEFPLYSKPEAIDQAMNISRSMSTQGLPGERLLEERLAGQVAGAEGAIQRTADTGAGALGALAGLYGRAQGSIYDLGIASAQARMANQRQYASDLANVAAPYADREWQQNVLYPFGTRMNMATGLTAGANQLQGSATDMRYAANQNFINSLTNTAGYAMMNPNIGGNMNFGSLFGGGRRNNYTTQGTGMGTSTDPYQY